jgi:hypothetical protein
MIKTRPIGISWLKDPKCFIYGDRVSYMLGVPFPLDVLKKRVLKKSKDGKKAEAVYYIDSRDLYDRLDRVVGPRNWSNNIFNIADCGDRICVVAEINIAGASRVAESEELKNTTKRDYEQEKLFKEAGSTEKTPIYKTVPNELVLLKAGPNALKRAGVGHNIGAYLYQFADVNTWEEIDQYSQFANPNIDPKKLPPFALPPGSISLVVRELGHLLDLDIPEDLQTLPQATVEFMNNQLKKFWNIDTLRDPRYNQDDLFNLAACMARVSDFMEYRGIQGDLDKFVESYQDARK